ncbi:MAG: hypothetical protein A2Y10_17410 [Planctomycetes bacterium GWF2_41_51]|nr:MAG: hypothetical protein A2Y10_17410 [Planctomycetes bacterium GWF2_41_51]HBG28005.1 hypothetical protein [Phycisphaerales bacterium]
MSNRHSICLIFVLFFVNAAFAEKVKPWNFPIGFWHTGMPTISSSAKVDDWVEAGITMPYISQTYSYYNKRILNWTNERGIQAIICDSRTYCVNQSTSEPLWANPNDYKTVFQEAVADYCSYPANFGYLVMDEPRPNNMQQVYEYIEIANSLDISRHRIVNFFPWYDVNTPYGSYETYSEYRNALLELHSGSGLNNLSFTSYSQMDPDYQGLGSTNGWKMFFQSLDRYGQWTDDNNKDMWVILLSTPHVAEGNYEMPSEAAFRWQFNSAIAYGCKGVVYYTFYTLNDPMFEDGPIGKDGTKTEIFYWMKNTHQKFHKSYGNLFLNLQLVKAMQAGMAFASVPLFAPDDLIKDIKDEAGNANYPFIVSRFTDVNNLDYVMIVNNDWNSNVICNLSLNTNHLRLFRYDVNDTTLVSPVKFSDHCEITVELLPGEEVVYRIEKCSDTLLNGDLNSDCYVNYDDLVILIQGWLSCGDVFNSNCN